MANEAAEAATQQAELKSYDVVVIGSGPGGYVAAIRAAQLGFKTAIVEKYPTLGGTCLNVGCIPSKALLDSSEHYHNAAHTFQTHGIDIKGLEVNMPQMIARKAQVVDDNVKGIAFLMKKNKIDVHQGVGAFVNNTTLSITPTAEGAESKTITSKYFIIATGSKPIAIPNVTLDKKRIITSTEALELTEVPERMVVIGGGVIGMELGSVFGRLGSKIEVVEFTNSLIPIMDASLGKELQKVLGKLGFTYHFGHKVTGAEVVTTGKGKSAKEVVKITAEPAAGGEAITLEADILLVSVGRRPYTDGLNAEAAGVEIDERGRVKVDEHLRTTAENIFAIGDVIHGAMLAHKAEEEGVFVAEHLAGQRPHINYLLIPNVVYTWPEVASVGYTEKELKDKGIAYKTGAFPFKASGRARASMDTDGFVRVYSDKTTDELLGVHMIGPRTADMIAEAVVAMEYRASAEDIARMSHAHPTYTEAFKEACLAATENRALHM